MMDLNNISVQGKLSNLEIIWEGNNSYLYKGNIITKRDNGIEDSLPLIIDGNLLKDINIDKFVFIQGQIRSRDSIQNDKFKVDVYIKVESICNTDSLDYKNEVLLDGYICKKPNLRNTPSGKQITDLLIANNQSKDKSFYIPSITWGRNARIVSKLKVGDFIHIKGNLHSRKYFKNIDGILQERITYELSIFKLD